MNRLSSPFIALLLCTTFSLGCSSDGDEDDHRSERKERTKERKKKRKQDEADVEACVAQMSQIETTLNRYRATNKKLPNTAEGLEAAAKLFPDGSVPLDPWGNEFQYTSDGNDFELVSLGKDGESGGEDANADISSKDLKAEKAE